MTERLAELVTESPKFFSEMDEEIFFKWLKQIKSIHNVLGELNFLKIKVKLNDLEEEEFRELIAIFKRFELNMAELKKLDADSHSSWFHNPIAYWHTQVFK